MSYFISWMGYLYKVNDYFCVHTLQGKGGLCLAQRS